jgi:hypothetical protein
MYYFTIYTNWFVGEEKDLDSTEGRLLRRNLHLRGKVVDVSRNIIKVVETRKFKFKFKCVGEYTDVYSENL